MTSSQKVSVSKRYFPHKTFLSAVWRQYNGVWSCGPLGGPTINQLLPQFQKKLIAENNFGLQVLMHYSAAAHPIREGQQSVGEQLSVSSCMREGGRCHQRRDKARSRTWRWSGLGSTTSLKEIAICSRKNRIFSFMSPTQFVSRCTIQFYLNKHTPLKWATLLLQMKANLKRSTS